MNLGSIRKLVLIFLFSVILVPGVLAGSKGQDSIGGVDKHLYAVRDGTLSPPKNDWEGFMDFDPYDSENLNLKNLQFIRSCSCSSGCGLIKKGLKPKIKAFVDAAAARGIEPISCVRTQTCQDRLRRCFTQCGQPGRAAKRSKHSEGMACDFSSRYRSKLQNWSAHGLNRRTYRSGGLHFNE